MSLERGRAVVDAVLAEGNGLLEGGLSHNSGIRDGGSRDFGPSPRPSVAQQQYHLAKVMTVVLDGHPDSAFDAAGRTFDCTVAALKCRRCTMAGVSAVPGVFKQQLDAVADGIAKQMTDMWEHLASGSGDPGEIDQLLRAYRSARNWVDLVWIPGESSGDEARKLRDVLAELLPEPPVWENAALGSLRSHVAESIRAAKSPDALDGILASLDPLPVDLSEGFRRSVWQMQESTIGIRDAWRVMRQGEVFASVDSFEWRPDGFVREESAEPGFRARLERPSRQWPFGRHDDAAPRQ